MPKVRLVDDEMRAKRTDANHKELRDGLRAHGYDVCDLSDCGHGVPDLVVRSASHGVPTFLEVKDGSKPPSKRVLTQEQVRWRQYCGEITHTVTSLEEALQVLSPGVDIDAVHK